MIDLSGMRQITTRGFHLSLYIARLDWRGFCAEVAIHQKGNAACAIRH